MNDYIMSRSSSVILKSMRVEISFLFRLFVFMHIVTRF